MISNLISDQWHSRGFQTFSKYIVMQFLLICHLLLIKPIFLALEMMSLFPVQTLMEELEPDEQFLQYARNGDLSGIQRLLLSNIKEETQININCKGREGTSSDSVLKTHHFLQNVVGNNVCEFSGKKKSNLGWTPLHLACYFGHKDVVEELLKVWL